VSDEEVKVQRGGRIAFVLNRRKKARRSARCAARRGISNATFYAWRKKYAGLMPSEMRWLRQLEDENAQLKRLVAACRWDKVT
jgi:putative transposase